MTLTPRRPDLLGTCQQAVETLVAADPRLTAVAGWYVDAVWGEREHWWAVTPDGEIVDPTVEQFPTGHVPELRHYAPYDGVYPCPGCGIAIACEDAANAVGFCCGACEGGTVGIPIGVCQCRDAREASSAPSNEISTADPGEH
ncbi:hypothetical protein ABT255_01755 [Streptomyces mirabilis]|uniref:hypothetical protein n=1 Tax=Streptomyces mirabilis TaxID=68239 RepID=UPI00331806A0